MANTKITAANIDSTSTGVTFADLTVNGDINLGDNDKAIFGAGSDLQIYHDGSNSFIRDAGTGNLVIRGTSLNLQKDGGESYITMVADGAVTLFHDNASKLATTSTGIDVTGTVVADGLTVNSSEVLFDNTGGDFTLKLNTNAVSDKNEIIMGDSGTPLAKFGVGGTADDIITGSDGQDFNIGTAGGGRAINFSTDNFASVEMKLDGGNLGIGRTDPTQLLEVHKSTGGDQTVAKFSAHNYGDTGKTFIEIGTEYGDGSSRIGSFNDTGNSSVLVFDTHSATSGQFTERMRIDSVGEVSIKRAGSGGSGVLKALNLNHAGTSVNDGAKISFTAGTSTEGAGIASTGQALNSADLRFYAGGNTERMRIDTSGNVGIGENNPLNELHVNGNVHIGDGEDYSSYAKLAVYGNVYQGDVALLIKNDRYNDSSATASLIFEHRTHAGQGHAAKIVCRRQSGYNESAGSKDAALDFYTAEGGTLAHQMQIDRNGNVGIGTGTSSISYPFIVQSGTTDQQFRLNAASSSISTMHAGFGCNPSTDITIQTQGNGALWRFGANVSNGNAYWINSNNVGVNFASGSNAWSAHSDERLKENITDIGPVLDKIQNYRCVSFNFKSSPEKELIGFIAQDWETDFPEVVDEDDAFTIQDDGSLVEKNKEENTSDIKVKSIAYTETIPVLLKAIQEQQTIIDDLKSRIEALEG